MKYLIVFFSFLLTSSLLATTNNRCPEKLNFEVSYLTLDSTFDTTLSTSLELVSSNTILCNYRGLDDQGEATVGIISLPTSRTFRNKAELTIKFTSKNIYTKSKLLYRFGHLVGFDFEFKKGASYDKKTKIFNTFDNSLIMSSDSHSIF